MGESIVETPFVNKMGEPVRSGPTLEVSVSFGRFDNDALSWEKWSSFSPNKYLEEVEKCSTPGSVAQKKAYFEAHYKKIAARKIEQIEQEKQQEAEKKMEPPSPKVAEPQFGDQNDVSTLVCNGNFSSSNGDKFAIDEQQKSVTDLTNSDAVAEPKEDIAVDVECDKLVIDESKEDISVDIECDSLSIAGPKEGTLSRINESKEDISVDVECDSSFVTTAKEGTILGTCDQGELHKAEEPNLGKGFQASPVETLQVENEAQKSFIKKTKNSDANAKNAPRKVYTTGDRVSAVTRKKLASPVTKSSKISTPASKPASKPTSTAKVISPSLPSSRKANGASTRSSNNTPLTQQKKIVPGSLVSPSQSLNKKLNGATLQRSKNSPLLENKRIAPTSLHMSLSLSSPNSSPSTTTMRKSLIMEKMGDKEIVKRAFRAFQNSLSQGQEQVSSKASESKISTFATPQKDNERLRKTPDKVNTLKGQSGTHSGSLSSGTSKDASMEKKKASSVGASTGSRIDRSAGKWKEEVTKAKIKRSGSNR